MFSKLIVNSAWYSILLSILFSAAVSYWLYFKNKKNKDISHSILYVLFGLRFVSLSLISLFLLNILLKRSIIETENPVILFALDNTASMVSNNDSQALKTSFLEELAVFKKQVGAKYRVKSLLFGSATESSEKTAHFNDKETDLSDLFRTLDNNYSNQNIGALVLVSDGIYNKGANPLYASEKINYPVYTIATGDTSEFRDVSIQKINHNQLTYSGNSFPVEVVIQAKKYSGERARVTLFEEGVQKAQTQVEINSAGFLSTVVFTLTAGKSGLNKYAAKIDRLEGEKNKFNNEQSFVMEVIDSKEKILLLAAGPHPDISAIKEALSGSSNYELEYSLYKDLSKPLKAYNLVIFHGYSAPQTALLNDCIQHQIPYWIIHPAGPDGIPDLKIIGVPGRYNDAEPTFVKSFALFNMSDAFKNFSADLPAVSSLFGIYKLSNGAQTLLKQRIGIVDTENPVLFFTESGSVKTAVFVGDGLWRWKLRDYAEHKNTDLFNELISKSVQFLTVKTDKSLFRVKGSKIVEENQAIEFEAEVYNKSYEAISEPEVNMVISSSDNKKYTYTFGKINQSYKLNVGSLPIGEYTYEASVKVNSELYTKPGRFVVREVMNEKINTVANHEILYQISKRTNGKMFYANQLKNLENDLLANENIKPITYTKKNTASLIDLIWMFWLACILLSTEWFIRRRYLSI